jgi:hypothetical protein
LPFKTDPGNGEFASFRKKIEERRFTFRFAGREAVERKARGVILKKLSFSEGMVSESAP